MYRAWSFLVSKSIPSVYEHVIEGKNESVQLAELDLFSGSKSIPCEHEHVVQEEEEEVGRTNGDAQLHL